MENNNLTLTTSIAKFISSVLLLICLIVLLGHSLLAASVYYGIVGCYVAIETYLTYPDIVKLLMESNKDIKLEEKEIEDARKFSAFCSGIFWVLYPLSNILIELGVLPNKKNE